MGLSDNKEARPRIIAWAPTEGVSAGPIIAALRTEGFIARIGSRREPAGNFEVEFKAEDVDLVRDVILGIDPGAAPLTVGR